MQCHYENMCKTMEMLQTKFAESASKISCEFEVMKQQQFKNCNRNTERFNEQGSLLELINKLQPEVEEPRELKQIASNFQEKNRKLISSSKLKQLLHKSKWII